MTNVAKLFASSLLVALTSVAHAGPAAEEEAVTIRFEEGMTIQELYTQIQEKGAVACWRKGSTSQWIYENQNRCKRDFVALAVQQFDIAALTALHESSSRSDEGGRLVKP